MEFLYVFALMFLSIFGLAMLLKLFFDALLRGSARRFDVYVRNDEGVEEFVRFARKCSHIENVNLILSGGECDDTALSLAEKFADVNIIGGQGR